MSDVGIGRRSLLGVAGLLIASPAWAAQSKSLAKSQAKPRVAIQTDHGTIVVELENAKAPITSTNFLRYVDAHKYDGGTFYRASKTKGVKGAGSIQGGPPDRVRRFAPIAHESTRDDGDQASGRDHLDGPQRPRLGHLRLLHLRQRPALSGRPSRCAGRQPGLRGLRRRGPGPGRRQEDPGPAGGRPGAYPVMKGQMLNPPVKIIGMKRV
jgi:peptidyl-prolyl cis-trans isomerase A (cyclophilin A)